MSLRFTLVGASLVLASACFSSADKAAAAKASPQISASVPAILPALPVPIVIAQAADATPPAAVAAVAAGASGGALYTVVDKNKVDPNTLMGWKTWRAQACERCHGANQEGLVGPSLVNSLKELTKDEFITTLKNGRIEKGMPNFGGLPNVVSNLDNLYAYLKGRSDGAIAPGRLSQIEK